MRVDGAGTPLAVSPEVGNLWAGSKGGHAFGRLAMPKPWQRLVGVGSGPPMLAFASYGVTSALLTQGSKDGTFLGLVPRVGTPLGRVRKGRHAFANGSGGFNPQPRSHEAEVQGAAFEPPRRGMLRSNI
jgi:hypothetical protein